MREKGITYIQRYQIFCILMGDFDVDIPDSCHSIHSSSLGRIEENLEKEPWNMLMSGFTWSRRLRT